MTKICRIKYSTKRNQIKVEKRRFEKFNHENLKKISKKFGDYWKFGDIGTFGVFGTVTISAKKLWNCEGFYQ